MARLQYKRCGACSGKGVDGAPGVPGWVCPHCEGWRREGGPVVGDILSTRAQYVIHRDDMGEPALWLERRGMRSYICDYNTTVQVGSHERLFTLRNGWLEATA